MCIYIGIMRFAFIYMHYVFQFCQITRVLVTWLNQFSMQRYHNDKDNIYVCMFIIDKYMTRIYWAYVLSIGAISYAHYLWGSTLEPLICSQVWVQMSL